MPFDLSPRPLLPPPLPPYRWWLPLPYLLLVTFALRWSSIYGTEDAVGALAVAVGGWLLGWCSYRASKSRYTPWLTGVYYCFVCSVYTPFGRQETRELVANLGPILAWLVAVAPREYGVGLKDEPLPKLRKDWALAGALVGAAATVHPLTIAALGGLLPYLNHYYRRKRRASRTAATLALLSGLALPLLVAAVGWVWAPENLAWIESTLSFANWGGQLFYLGQYLLYFLPLMVFSFISMFGNILSSSRTDFGALLPGHAWALVLVIVLCGGGTTAPLVLLHPVLALQCAELTTASGTPAYNEKHGFTLLLVLSAALGVGYLHFG